MRQSSRSTRRSNVHPGTPKVDSPAPATVTTCPSKFLPAANSEIQESHLRSARRRCPRAWASTPRGRSAFSPARDAQFKKGQRDYSNAARPHSRSARVEIESPPLSQPLPGDIYVGEQKSTDPTSGEEFRILFEAKAWTEASSCA